jgi:predicted nucleic acid-binding protein
MTIVPPMQQAKRLLKQNSSNLDDRVYQHQYRPVSLLPVVPLPGEAATAYGEIRAALEARGEMIGGNDLWIAAHAKSAGLTLVTNNEREFKRVPGLKLQNWTSRRP